MTHSIPAKITSVILSFAFLLVLSVSMICTVLCFQDKAFVYPKEAFVSNAMNNGFRYNAYDIVNRYAEYGADGTFEDMYSSSSTSVSFSIYRDNTLVYSNFQPETPVYGGTCETTALDQSENTVRSYSVKYAFDLSSKVSDSYIWKIRLYEYIYVLRYLFPVVCLISLILLVLTVVSLCCGSGRKRGVEGIYKNGIHRIPFDIMLAACAAVAFFFTALLLSISGIVSFVFIILVPLWYGMLLLIICCFAAHIKAQDLISTCITIKLLCFIGRQIRVFLSLVPIMWKFILLYSLLGVLDLLLFTAFHNDPVAYIIWALAKTIVFIAAFRYVNAYRHTSDKAIQMASGDLSCDIDTKGFPPAIEKHAASLNSIKAAVNTAVDERMKSERLKTELITNVSHDIKTPLTSIVNYVDLLGRENIENDTANEYIEILKKQSAKLKKLIEDLIDASKASTGNIKAELSPVNAGVVLAQTSGEYTDKLAASGLTLVLDDKTDSAFISADSRLLWRVFDNLLGNICKYSMPQSRVYISAFIDGYRLVISFKNISKNPLNISAEELMGRFVRGDVSRHTEGSGLGLSIAKSLTQLMGGALDLTIDGDLFKAELSFDVSEHNETELSFVKADVSDTVPEQ